jgi:hypothetical protein
VSSSRNTVIRSMHDVGAAAWFGGALAGAVALNGAAGDIADPRDRARIAADGWARWAPVAATAIGAHVVGGAGLVLANRGRVANQRGTTVNTAAKTAVTLAAVATTAYSGMLGARLARTGAAEPVESGAVPGADTTDDVAGLQQRLRVLQWAIPALTGVIVVLGAQQGEQQRPAEIVKGMAAKAAGRARRGVLRSA